MKKLNVKLLLLTFGIFSCIGLFAQTLHTPLKIVNHTKIHDDSIFVAILGQRLEGLPIYYWVDKNGKHNIMDSTDNTVYRKPDVVGLDSMFAHCFYKLSELTNNTIPLPAGMNGRIWISENSQLYLRFLPQHGGSVVGGYIQPSYTNPTDPNWGIIYEFIEFTYDTDSLFFGNTSRVGAYRRPNRLQVKGDSINLTVGDSAKLSYVITRFKELIITDTTFKHCLDLTDSTILQFTKTMAFFQGIGRDFFTSYIDAIWEKYKNDSLKFWDPSNKWLWAGKVDNNNKFKFIIIKGQHIGDTAQIDTIPTTQLIIECSGVLANGTANDLDVQKWFAAALNRGVIDTTKVIQDWHDTTLYYKTPPFNHYAGFWHQPGISIDRLAYGFAYDDVYNLASAIPSSKPDSIIIHWGWHDELGSSSVSEVIPVQLIKVYPNITSNRCTVSGLDKSYLLNLIDLNGQLVKSIKLNPNLNKIDLDLSEFSNGLYLIQVHSENGIGLTKVIRR